MNADFQQNGTNETRREPPARVYQKYYHLTEPPFAITPDPEFLFFSSKHRQVFDKISYAIECRMGFVLLTGEVGTGKTTLCRSLLDQLEGNANTVYIINPSISGQELLASILEDLGFSSGPDATKKELLDRLNQLLLDTEGHTPTVVIIDDAQTMSPETLEDLRLLSNLETDKQKLLQVVLSGQPELLERLKSQNLRQLRQRIAIRCGLAPLSAQETEAYTFRRLSVAGNKGQVRFSPSAMRRIHKSSNGIPRYINRICDYALTAGYVGDDAVIDCIHVKRALAELEGAVAKQRRFSVCASLAYATVLLSVAVGTLFSLGSNAGSIETFIPDELTPAAVLARSEPKAISTDSLQRLHAEDSSGHQKLPVTSEEKSDSKDRAAVEGAEAKTSSNVSNDAPERTRPSIFALQLGSYRDLKSTKRSIAHYKEKGIVCHWQALNEGKWFRVVTGTFETEKIASRFKSKHGLNEARVIRAPFTVRVMGVQPGIPAAEISSMLSRFGYDCLLEEPQKGESSCYTGVFKSIENALETARQLNDEKHLLAQVVRRQAVKDL